MQDWNSKQVILSSFSHFTPSPTLRVRIVGGATTWIVDMSAQSNNNHEKM